MMSRSCGSNKTAQHVTIDLLKDTFGDRLISSFGPVNWPPRSCDLTPLDYFLWGYIKSLVYADKPQTLDHLEDNIRRVIADIRPQMLEKVIENWTSRLNYIRASRGSPMPEIIFEISIPLKNTLYEAMLMEEELYNYADDMLVEKNMINDEDLIHSSESWLEIYANLQSPKTPKSISDKVLYRFITQLKPIPPLTKGRIHQRINEGEELISERTLDAKVEKPGLRKGNNLKGGRTTLCSQERRVGHSHHLNTKDYRED
ncbi:hypothetical protein TNCV_2809911 [Trichonephila clavipes]|nr:hypothetical protein TNCV_2809911 [Trichonephila clavipes]